MAGDPDNAEYEQHLSGFAIEGLRASAHSGEASRREKYLSCFAWAQLPGRLMSRLRYRWVKW